MRVIGIKAVKVNREMTVRPEQTTDLVRAVGGLSSALCLMSNLNGSCCNRTNDVSSLRKGQIYINLIICYSLLCNVHTFIFTFAQAVPSLRGGGGRLELDWHNLLLFTGSWYSNHPPSVICSQIYIFLHPQSRLTQNSAPGSSYHCEVAWLEKKCLKFRILSRFQGGGEKFLPQKQ